MKLNWTSIELKDVKYVVTRSWIFLYCCQINWLSSPLNLMHFEKNIDGKIDRGGETGKEKVIVKQCCNLCLDTLTSVIRKCLKKSGVFPISKFSI